MTAPAPTVCPVCKGDGVQPVLLDAGLMQRVIESGVLPKLAGGPCLVCRCFCGQPSLWPAGLCEGHERGIDTEGTQS